MQAYNKAIVALVVPAALMGLEHFGITADMRVDEALYSLFTLVATTAAVWFVPNKK